tara:strand:+ start:504 stop:1844 length:1341 start_codon:yes stop_codon:yes gene_type:complete
MQDSKTLQPKLDSELWEEPKYDELKMFEPLADNIVFVAEFLFVKVKSVARFNKEIFGKSLSEAFLESTDWKNNNHTKVIAGSTLDQAYSLLELRQSERPYLTKQLYQIVKMEEKTEDFTFLNDVEEKEVDWLAQDWLQKGVVHQIVGAMDNGKSYFTAEISAQVSKGGELFGHPVEKGKVLYISTEDSADTVIIKRIKSLGGDLNNIAVYTKLAPISFPSGIDRLFRFVVEHRPSVIVLDPILSMFEGDMNSEVSARKVINPLVQLAQFFNIAIINVTHAGKTKKGHPNLDALGSQGITAITRANFYLALDEDTGERIITCIKNNNGGIKLSWSFEIVDHEGFSAPRIKHNGLTEVKAQELGSTEPLRDELKLDILEVIEDREVIEGKALKELFKNDDRVSQSMRTFEEARAELKKAGKIDNKVIIDEETNKRKTVWFIPVSDVKL